MKLTEDKKREYIKRILFSRLRILNDYGFYGLLLMHVKFGLDEATSTAYTDGHIICFSPKFLDELSDSELDFVMMHEILHIALKHVFRGQSYDNDKFNIACDIVVNSNILYSHNMDLSSITLKDEGPAMHTINGKEGYEYTAEEVYNMLPDIKKKKGNVNVINVHIVDDHNHWLDSTDVIIGEGDNYIDEWEGRILSAIESIRIKESSNQIGNLPLGAYRMYNDLKDSTVDWRALLADFINYEVNDYSFTPPDRRFDESPFFLPDFNELEENTTINILFEVDTSGSMSDDDITDAYSEIKGAIEFKEKNIKGWLGFYDTNVYEPKPFSDVSDILKIKPVGGGGTRCVSF